MTVTGVDFVSVPTQDLERAVAFYEALEARGVSFHGDIPRHGRHRRYAPRDPAG